RLQAYSVLEDLLPLGLEVLAEQVHQARHLIHGTRPVLRRERVERQRLDADAARGAGHLADAVAPLAMALQARQPLLLGPPPVAVHDDAHVGGQRSLSDLHLQRVALHGRRSHGLAPYATEVGASTQSVILRLSLSRARCRRAGPRCSPPGEPPGAAGCRGAWRFRLRGTAAGG